MPYGTITVIWKTDTWRNEMRSCILITNSPDWLTDQPTSQKRAFLVTLTVLQLFTKLAEFYSTQRFIIFSQKVHLSVSWTRIIRPMYCIEAQQCNVWWNGNIAPVTHVDTILDWGWFCAPSSSVAPTTWWRNPPVPVVWKAGCGLQSFGLGGIEGNTCCVEGWLGTRTVRGMVESKDIPVGCSMSNSNFRISSELSGLCFLKRLAPAGVKPTCVLVRAHQRCGTWQHVTAFNQPEMSPAGLCY